MVKYCCHGFCCNDSRNADRNESMQGISFIRIPKPKDNLDKCARWMLACGHEDMTFERVTKDAYICSKHFVGGQGPTDEFPDPLPVSEADFAADFCIRRQSKRRVCRPLELANRMFGQYGEQVLMGKMSCARILEEQNQVSAQQEHQTSGIKQEVEEPQASGSTLSVIELTHQQPLPSASTALSNATESNTLSPSQVSSLEKKQVPLARIPSQTPTAVRMRKWRKNMMLNQDKYEKLKLQDRIRNKKARDTLTEEQKERSRGFARERTRRCRMRKKLLNSGKAASKETKNEESSNQVGAPSTTMEYQPPLSTATTSMTRTTQQDAKDLQVHTPEMETTTFYQPAIQSPPTAVLSGSHASVHSHQDSGMTDSVIAPGTSNDRQCMVGRDKQHLLNEIANMQKFQSTGTDNDVTSHVPVDVFMWAGPDMVNKETNTESCSTSQTLEKGCQIQTKYPSKVLVSEASVQTDLTLNDMAMYDTDNMLKDSG